MPTFLDDFERANGDPGANWSNLTSTATISGGTLVGTSQWATRCTAVSDNTRSEAWARFVYDATYCWYGRLFVKIAAGGSDGYRCCVGNTSGVHTFYLYAGPIGGGVVKASTVLEGSPGYIYSMRLVYDDGNLTATLNDAITLNAQDATYANQPYTGLGGLTAYNKVLDFGAVGGSAVEFNVSPNVIGNYGRPTPLTFTGTNTAWTPGTPGAPIFTVNHGSLSAQTVVDATHATATYDPGSYLGSIIFTDPSTGATVGAVVTSNTVILPPSGAGDTWSPYKSLVDATGTLFRPDYLLTDQTPIIEESESVPGRLAILDAIRQIWNAHFGTWTGAPPTADAEKLDKLWYILNGHLSLREEYDLPYDEPIASTLKKALDVWLAPGGATLNTSQDILDAIAGIAGASDAQVRTDLGIRDQFTYVSLLQALITLAGNLATQASDNYTQIRTDLGIRDQFTYVSILDAIKEVSVDLSPVTSKLALIQPSSAYSLTTLAAQSASLITSALAIKVELDEVRALVEGLEIPASSGGGPPLWPGETNVTLSASQALSHGLVVDGPMHGVLLTITGHPAHNTRYLFGMVSSWARVGQIVFRSDRGDYERSQTFSMDAQIMVPATMEAAESATIRLNEGWTGTVRAWSKA